MAVKSQQELLIALQSAEYSQILDTPECKWVDFKSKQYKTAQDKPLLLSNVGKAELCKDVSAFANYDGGVLLLGVKETKSRTSGLSVAGRLTSIKVEAVDLKHYKDVLMAGIYPIVENVKIEWFIVEEETGLLAIVIPKSKRGKHILRHVYDDNQKLLNGLGIVRRVDDLTYTYTAEALYDLINNQKNQAPTIIPRQSNYHRPIPPEALQRVIANHKAIKEKNEQEGRQIGSQLLTMNDWDNSPVFILQSIPLTDEENLIGFYDKVKQAFIETVPTRGMGFNLNSIGRESNTVDGAFIKSGMRDAVLRLDPNGALTLMMLASNTLLGWAMQNAGSGASMKVNSIVLVEMVYEFVRYVHRTLTKFGLSSWEYVIDIQNFKSAGVRLYEGTPGSLGVYDTSPAQKDEYIRKVMRSEDYAHDSVKVLTEVYALFALPESAIPYATEGKITSESIKSIDASGR